MKLQVKYILFLILLSGCSMVSEKPGSVQLLRNTDFSTSSDNVLPWVAINKPGFRLGTSDTLFRSGKQAIFISNSDRDNTNVGTWTQTYAGSIPKSSQRLRLRAHIRGENLNLTRLESGIYISIRVFPVVERETILRFASSQNFSNRFRGTFDWQTLEIIIPQLPENIDNIRVYLNMGAGTTGTVFFDDITLYAE